MSPGRSSDLRLVARLRLPGLPVAHRSPAPLSQRRDRTFLPYSSGFSHPDTWSGAIIPQPSQKRKPGISGGVSPASGGGNSAKIFSLRIFRYLTHAGQDANILYYQRGERKSSVLPNGQREPLTGCKGAYSGGCEVRPGARRVMPPGLAPIAANRARNESGTARKSPLMPIWA